MGGSGEGLACSRYKATDQSDQRQRESVEDRLMMVKSDYSAGELRAPVGRELVLDYIIERKRMDDLCGSIIDGRFREQKVSRWDFCSNLVVRPRGLIFVVIYFLIIIIIFFNSYFY